MMRETGEGECVFSGLKQKQMFYHFVCCPRDQMYKSVKIVTKYEWLFLAVHNLAIPLLLSRERDLFEGASKGSLGKLTLLGWSLPLEHSAYNNIFWTSLSYGLRVFNKTENVLEAKSMSKNEKFQSRQEKKSQEQIFNKACFSVNWMPTTRSISLTCEVEDFNYTILYWDHLRKSECF